MKPSPIRRDQTSLFSSFEDQLSHNHPLYKLSHLIDWQMFEREFMPLYSSKPSRPAKPIRLMVGLLILKHVRNISDESVVEQWAENSYYQYFCGYASFVPNVPCDPSELVHFRHRIGERGIELILQESIRVNQDHNDDDKNGGDVAFIDTTVQEKNITFPTDAKLHKKIIKKCKEIAQEENLPVRQTYTRTLKRLSIDQRFRNHPKNNKKAKKADKKVRTIAGRLVRELDRNLCANSHHRELLDIFKRILGQRKNSKNKIYSIHEPKVECISKGKEHKKYEFGNKVSIIRTMEGLIVGALSFRKEYDGHTVEKSLEQTQRMTGERPTKLAGDRGYRGRKWYSSTELVIPSSPSPKDSRYQKAKKRVLFRKRAAIEPIIGHLKSDHRLNRNFYKGLFGDAINVMLAATAFNFKRMMAFLWAYICEYIRKNIRLQKFTEVGCCGF
ncbi:MAG: IS5 family transposase [Rikenellaceae bacterium]